MHNWDLSNPMFSLYADGDPISPDSAVKTESESVKNGTREITVKFRFENGLTVTQSGTEYTEYGAYYWRLNWSYDGNNNSPIFSDMMDADFETEAGAITRCIGDRAAANNFENVTETPEDGQTLSYDTSISGRPTYLEAPYYDIAQPDGGLIMTIGWSGTWRASFARTGDKMRVTACIDGIETYLKPGESIQTASILVLPYQGSRNAAHVVFRRLLKNKFSLIGQPGRPAEEPLCEQTWGGYPNYRHKEIINALKKYLPQVECYWVDASWFGNDPLKNHTEMHNGEPYPEEGDLYYEGDCRWFNFVGDWETVNKERYPNGLEEISDCAKENGLSFLLWLESERNVSRPEFPIEHRERYMFRKDPEANRHFWSFELDEGTEQSVLNLGCPEGLEQAKESAFKVIDRYGVDCMRQDFNVLPAPYWEDNDEEGRKGMCQIRYVNGLYAFWDAVLERYPNIIIDNCCGGGCRLELELLRRSVNLWRSDYHHKTYTTRQFQTEALSWWIPYFGGYIESVIHDDPSNQVYNCRSAYAPALTGNFFTRKESEYAPMGALLDEYLSVRPYLSEDYYPVFGQSLSDDDWGGWQFDRPENGDGILMAFCRENAPLQTSVKLEGLCADADYELVDRDSGKKTILNGLELMQNGLLLSAPETRTSFLIDYKRI